MKEKGDKLNEKEPGQGWEKCYWIESNNNKLALSCYVDMCTGK